MKKFSSSGFRAVKTNPPGFKFPIFLLLLSLLLVQSSFAQEIYTIATYNIRYANPNDEGNLWKDRAPHLINLIRFHEMDIIGTQEGLYQQLEEIKEDLNFPYIGVGRDTGKNEGEFSAVFYNPDKFTLLDQDSFWLSPTPEKPSKGWDASLNRIDYIFVSDRVSVIHQATLSDNYGKKYPSDHFPVVVKVMLDN